MPAVFVDDPLFDEDVFEADCVMTTVCPGATLVTTCGVVELDELDELDDEDDEDEMLDEPPPT